MFVDRLFGLASPAAALRRAITLIEQERGAEAFPLLTRAAKAGIPQAEYRIARAYLEGAGVPRSQNEGARWLERSAAHDFVEAQTLLAALCVRGLGQSGGAAGRLFTTDAPADPDFVSALKWARRAAEAGSAEGQALLGY